MKYTVFGKNIYGEVENLVVHASGEAMALWIAVQYAPHLDPYRVEAFQELVDETNVIRVDFQSKKRAPMSDPA